MIRINDRLLALCLFSICRVPYTTRRRSHCDKYSAFGPHPRTSFQFLFCLVINFLQLLHRVTGLSKRVGFIDDYFSINAGHVVDHPVF